MNNRIKKHYVVLSITIVCATVAGIIALFLGHDALAGTMLGYVIGGAVTDLQRSKLVRGP